MSNATATHETFTTCTSDIHEGDPANPKSWVGVCTRYANGEMSSRLTHGQNPKNPDSWVWTRDANGEKTSQTYGQDPSDPRSWVCIFDANGEKTSQTYGQDPSDPRSWSKI